jgi:hypothetical protein
MSRLMQLRLAFFGIGIAVWGYGIAADDATIRWIGIGFLMAALFLRFFNRDRRSGDQPPT